MISLFKKLYVSENGFFWGEARPRIRHLLFRDRQVRIGVSFGIALSIFLMMSARRSEFDVSAGVDVATLIFQVTVPTSFTAAAIILSVVSGRLMRVLAQPSGLKTANNSSKFEELSFSMLWSATCNIICFISFLVMSTTFNRKLRVSEIELASWDYGALVLSCILVGISTSMLFGMVDVIMQVAKYAFIVEIGSGEQLMRK